MKGLGGACAASAALWVVMAAAALGDEGGSGKRVGHLEFHLKRKHDERRTRLLAAEGFAELAMIKREPDGVYWSDLKIADPPQMFSVIVDTGSSTIAVPCKSCNCGNHNHFDLDKAHGAKMLTSKYRQCYSEGSCNSGNYVEAKMCLGESCDVATEGVVHRFGCCEQFASAFKKQEADGIIGMSGESGTLLADLRVHNKLEKDIFALCLSQSEGVLGVGGFDESRHLEPVQWVPMNIGNFYKVRVAKMYVAGKDVQVGTLPTPIVDSGTTFTYVPTSAHAALQRAFNEFCARSEANCPGERNPMSALAADRRDSVNCYAPPASVSSNDLTRWLESFPSLEFEFESGKDGSKPARICIPPASYLFKSTKSAYCVGILKGASKFVLGALTMAGFDYIFDHANSRLGLTRSICNSKHDKDPDYRNSVSYCCGSCAVAQRSGFNQGTRTPLPTRSPTTSSPTPAPTHEIQPGDAKTSDKLFSINTNVTQFPGKEVLIPVDGTSAAWAKSGRAFSAAQVLILRTEVRLCESADGALSFDPESTIVVTGFGVVVHFGTACTFPRLVVRDGARVVTLPAPGALGSAADVPTTPVVFSNVVSLDRSHMLIDKSTMVEFRGAGNLSMSLTSVVEVMPHSRLKCGMQRRESLVFGHGQLLVRAPALAECYITVGEFATMQIVPDVASERPFNSVGTIHVQGTLAIQVIRNPFRSFALLTNSTLIWDHHFTTTYRVELDQDSGDIVHDLPEKARLITVVRGGIQDTPDKLDMPPEFACSHSALDNTTIAQVRFSSPECFNKCVDDSDQSCTAAERERAPWPPLPPVIPVPGYFDEDDNSTLASYYNQVASSLGLHDAASRQFALDGALAGIVVSLVVFLLAIAPRRLLCCCARAGGTRYDSI